MRYIIRDRTPKSLACGIGACPSIYERLRELTPPEIICLAGACPASYEARHEGKAVYLIVGKTVEPKEAGLEEKVGEGEALIEVPKELIDKMNR